MPVILSDKYELGRTLGSGVSCKVKIARDSAGTRYAIKVFHGNMDLQECITTEIQILQQLDHANIVRFVEVGEGLQVHPKKGQKNVKYIVLELVGGGELFDFVALGGRLTEPVARFYFRQLIDGLGYVHNRGFAHRDLKPENLLLDANFVLKITDFGFSAPMVGRDNSGFMETQLGTLSYMAPEIHLGREYEGAKVDLFATGIILFTILSQRPPFRCAKPDDPHYSLLAQNDFDTFWRLNQDVEGGQDIFSAEFKDLFQKLMSLSPAKRPNIEQINAHPWMQGAVPSQEEITTEFTTRKGLVDAESKKDRDQKRQQRAAGDAKRVMRSGGAGAQVEAEDDDIDRSGWENLEIQEYGPLFIQSNTQFFMTSDPLDYFEDLLKLMQKNQTPFSVSGSKLMCKFNTVVNNQEVQVQVQILSVAQGKSCVKFTYKNPSTKLEIRGNEVIENFMLIRDHEKLSMFNDTTYDEQSSN